MEREGHKEHKGHEGLGSRLETVGREVVDSAIKVHRHLGPGLLESIYEHCLARELELRGLEVVRQVPIPVRYEDQILEAGYRLDLIADDCVVIEVKALESVLRLHEAQLLTYLRLSDRRLGYLLNFNVTQMRPGIRRFVV